MNTKSQPVIELQLNSDGATTTPSFPASVDSPVSASVASPRPMIKVSNRALVALQSLSTQYSVGQLTRLGVKGGGCAGLSYLLEAGYPKENDFLIYFEQVTLAIEPSHALYIDGLSIDIGEGLNNRGFVFENPNAESTCGCGSSFSV